MMDEFSNFIKTNMRKEIKFYKLLKKKYLYIFLLTNVTEMTFFFFLYNGTNRIEESYASTKKCSKLRQKGKRDQEGISFSPTRYICLRT